MNSTQKLLHGESREGVWELTVGPTVSGDVCIDTLSSRGVGLRKVGYHDNEYLKSSVDDETKDRRTIEILGTSHGR